MTNLELAQNEINEILRRKHREEDVLFAQGVWGGSLDGHFEEERAFNKPYYDEINAVIVKYGLTDLEDGTIISTL